MQIGAKKLCDEIAAEGDVRKRQRKKGGETAEKNKTYMSSRGEMKISLREMTCESPNVSMERRVSSSASSSWLDDAMRWSDSLESAYIFVSEMLEQLQLAVRPLSEHRRAKGLHDLLDGDILVGELVSRRAIWRGRGKSQLARIASKTQPKMEGGNKLTRQDQTLPCPRAGGPST